MMVIHALWADRTGTDPRLHVWAETSDLPRRVPLSRGRPPKNPKPRLHPFSLSPEAMLEPLNELAGSIIGESATSEALCVLLPSVSNAPRPSSPLIREDGTYGEKSLGLLPWNIRTLTMDPALALYLLLSFPNKPPRHGIIFGDSLRFWTEAGKFAIELVARQCFMPSLRRKDEDPAFYYAAWEPVFSEEDAKRLDLLRAAMPPICRAIITDGKDYHENSDVVSDFINRTVDAFARESLSSTSILPSRRGRLPKVMPLAEQWLEALSLPDISPLRASPEELGTFNKKIRNWLGQINTIEPGTPFRTCFRLEEPPPVPALADAIGQTIGDTGRSRDWKVSFHLQASDDRSLLIPASDVWRSRSGTITFLKQRFENPQERLLADLGRASRLFPLLEKGLETARPGAIGLQTDEAYGFLREYAPLLKQSGFGVLLPVWWNKPTQGVGIKLKVKPKKETGVRKKGLLGINGIVDYDWEIAIGDKTLSPEEFERLAALKIPLVSVRGQWVELRGDEMERAIEFFKKKHANGEMMLADALRLGLGQDYSELGMPVMEIKAEGWIGDIINDLKKGIKIPTIKTPRGFVGKLRPYQRKGLSWLVFLKRFGIGACLADDMGLGKTIQFIALLLHERTGKTRGKKKRKRGRPTKTSGLVPGPSLLVCPMSIVGNWYRELERFSPSLSVMVHHGSDRHTGKNFKEAVKKHDIIITTYGLTHRDENDLSAVDWDCVVLDEAQNIKNTAARQTQAVRKLKAAHRIALTGTPVENKLSELWSIMQFLNPGYLRSAKMFRKSFANPIEKYHDTERANVLKRLIQPFVLRRLKSDPKIIKDLPEKMEMKVYCNLTREQALLYEAVVKEMLVKIEGADGITRKGMVLSTLMKLKQICNHPAQFLHDGSSLPGRSGKLIRLTEMLEEVLAEGDRALIFTQFSEMGGMLRHYLQEKLGFETLFLYGGTPKKKRDGMTRRFQQEGDRGPPLFVLSLKAGGVGLNLTAANRVFHFDRWWNPAVENQATDRVFRIGQKKNVQVHKFVCIGTLEERIDQMIERKKELAESIVGTGESWLTEMSTDQLKEMFSLSREAVMED